MNVNCQQLSKMKTLCCNSTTMSLIIWLWQFWWLRMAWIELPSINLSLFSLGLGNAFLAIRRLVLGMFRASRGPYVGNLRQTDSHFLKSRRTDVRLFGSNEQLSENGKHCTAKIELALFA
mmetsp:Transcript_2035/g.3600  ORF Transcript_2035/g.3600 Transcript_2035/m.3600 type:complete len:120 (-) Transcript_2035:553-912(-)